MHFEILDNARKQLLAELSDLPSISQFCLGGGTALSLQLGLRESYDFDFFSSWHFDPEVLLQELRDRFGERVQVTREETRISTLDCYIDQVQVSFFEDRYPPLRKAEPLSEGNSLSLLSIEDIACMKSVAIVRRGTKKDFFDLYFILKLGLVDGAALKEMLKEKYKDNNLLTNFSYSLVYFSDAEEEGLPKSFVPYSWKEIKTFFIRFQILFSKLV